MSSFYRILHIMALLINNPKGRRYMKVDRIKVLIFCFLLTCLALLVFYKVSISAGNERWMTIKEKYYPQNNQNSLIGIKTEEVIEGEQFSCAFKFKESKRVIYSVECDRYVDFRVGEKVRVTVNDQKIVKIRRK
jgi:hypothetical protein